MNKHIKKLLNKKIAFVGSVHDNKPQIKSMLVNKREGGNVFYFASNNGSQRVKQWQENPNACVYFYAKPIYRGVMLNGTMEVINDMAVKQAQWHPSMKFVYKDGYVNDPDYCILKFTATSGRYYSMLKSEDIEV